MSLEVGQAFLVIVDAEMDPEMITEDKNSPEFYQKEWRTSYKAISLLLLSVLRFMVKLCIIMMHDGDNHTPEGLYI